MIHERNHNDPESALPLTALAAVAVGLIAAGSPEPAVGHGWGSPPAANGVGRSVVMILGSYGTACTATAIARDLLLTAAHCVQPGADYKLVGSAPGQEPVLKNIVRIERDPQFELKRLFGHLATADVALIKLDGAVAGPNPTGAARR